MRIKYFMTCTLVLLPGCLTQNPVVSDDTSKPHIDQLEEDVRRDGLAAVVQRKDLSEHDKDILSMIANLLKDHESERILGDRVKGQNRFVITGGDMSSRKSKGKSTDKILKD